MHVQVLLLLLLGLHSAIAISLANLNVEREDYATALGKHLSYVESNRIPDNRQRREVPETALQGILKSSLGSTLREVNGRISKVYVKQGTFFEALSDFYSLNPERVIPQLDGEFKLITGIRDNLFFTVHHSRGGSIRASLMITNDYKTNPKDTNILYFDDPADAAYLIGQ